MSTALTLQYGGYDYDPITGGYPLGCGYRIYLPSLMRFTASDTSSPFDEGGINAYTYCGADPVNRRDPSGHVFLPAVLAIGSVTAIAVKAAGSLLVRKFRAPVKEWIDGLRIDEHIGAFNAERASVNKTWATRDVSARNRSPDRPTNSKDAGAFTAKQAASPKKLARAVTRRLERVDKDLAAARVHRERTRLLQLGARGSHDPELVMQLAFEEREEGLADLDSARQLIDTIAPVKSNLNSELKNRLDVADREQETLRHDFDRRFLSNRFRDR